MQNSPDTECHRTLRYVELNVRMGNLFEHIISLLLLLFIMGSLRWGTRVRCTVYPVPGTAYTGTALYSSQLVKSDVVFFRPPTPQYAAASAAAVQFSMSFFFCGGDISKIIFDNGGFHTRLIQGPYGCYPYSV